MHNYVIAEIAGYQFRIEEGAKLDVPRLEAEVGETVTLDKLLLINAGGEVTVGAPYIEGKTVEAKVVDHTRGKKVLVLHKRRRVGYKKLQGARAYYTTLEVASLGL